MDAMETDNHRQDMGALKVSEAIARIDEKVGWILGGVGTGVAAILLPQVVAMFRRKEDEAQPEHNCEDCNPPERPHRRK